MHRLSTNAFRDLQPFAGQPTVLASPTGRVLAFVVAYVDQEALFLRCQPGRAPVVARYSERPCLLERRDPDCRPDPSHGAMGPAGAICRASHRAAQPAARITGRPGALQLAHGMRRWPAGALAAPWPPGCTAFTIVGPIERSDDIDSAWPRLPTPGARGHWRHCASRPVYRRGATS